MKSKHPKLESPKFELIPTPSQFSFAITKIAVAQICQSAGFKAAQTSALEPLTEIAAGYLQALAKSATASANSSGRTESNVFDIIKSLEDLCSVQGFRGASDVNHSSLVSSSPLKDIMKFVNNAKEVPFAKPIPRKNCHFSSRKQRNCLYDSEDMNNNVKPRSEFGNGVLKHVPKWLPELQAIGKEKGKKWREEKWGFGSVRKGEEGCLVGEKRESKLLMDLPLIRGKIKFKIDLSGGIGKEVGNEKTGVDLRSGIICSGGKRVLCYHCDFNKKKAVL